MNKKKSENKKNNKDKKKNKKNKKNHHRKTTSILNSIPINSRRIFKNLQFW